jgi:hypothetical protein
MEDWNVVAYQDVRKTYMNDCTGCGQKCGKCHRLKVFAIAFEYIELKDGLVVCVGVVPIVTRCWNYGGTGRI